MIFTSSVPPVPGSMSTRSILPSIRTVPADVSSFMGPNVPSLPKPVSKYMRSMFPDLTCDIICRAKREHVSSILSDLYLSSPEDCIMPEWLTPAISASISLSMASTSSSLTVIQSDAGSVMARPFSLETALSFSQSLSSAS